MWCCKIGAFYSEVVVLYAGALPSFMFGFPLALMLSEARSVIIRTFSTPAITMNHTGRVRSDARLCLSADTHGNAPNKVLHTAVQCCLLHD